MRPASPNMRKRTGIYRIEEDIGRRRLFGVSVGKNGMVMVFFPSFQCSESVHSFPPADPANRDFLRCEVNAWKGGLSPVDRYCHGKAWEGARERSGAKLLLFEVYTACSVGLLDDEIVIFETKKAISLAVCVSR